MATAKKPAVSKVPAKKPAAKTTPSKAPAAKTAKSAATKTPVAKPQAPVKKSASKGGGAGTRAQPWTLKTPPGSSEFIAFRDEALDPPALVVQVGKTELRYHVRAIDDLHAMLKKKGDWVALGGADEQKPAAEGTVEAWGRAASNPVKGWYGLKKGLRGRFGVYVPPVLEVLGLAEVEHLPKNNRMRAK